MFIGYFLILGAATFWGGSIILAKHLFARYDLSPLFISQTRVTFAWAVLCLFIAITRPSHLRIRIAHVWRFALLGVIGVAATNYLLYYAIEGMHAALADLIQFTAPVMVALWMWLRGFESMDRYKVAALALSLVGCALALGVFAQLNAPMPPIRVGAAFASALSYVFLVVWGKHMSRQYPVATYLHYALFAAALFWAIIVPTREWARLFHQPEIALVLFGFAMVSVMIPYTLFFAGLKRVPASRAGIVSTWEPVAITVGAWAFLGESLSPSQVLGVAFVVAAIVIAEAFSRGEKG